MRFWFAVFGPKGMPPYVIEKLQKAIQSSLEDPGLKSKLSALDITPEFAAGPDLQKRVVADIENWSAFIEAKGLKGR